MLNPAAGPVLQLIDVHRAFRQGARQIQVLKGVNGELWAGQSVALVGPSGSGKSTLLHIAGLLEAPTSGAVVINGRDCAGLSEGERTRLRRREIGFIYQFHQLLPEFSALENVVIPQLILGERRRDANDRARALLSGLGLGDRVDHRPAELSGGEQQRTAICRALANAPRLLLADEPTGNLDPETSEYVFQELIGLIRQQGVAALIATHNIELARRMDRIFRVQDGQLVETSAAALA
ncbi:MAG: ABC transporter ATP-binding protein [Hyphomicrobium sp.]